MEQNTIFLFIVTSVSLTLFPGPDIMYVISTSLAKGWRKGVLFSFGLCSGLIIHTLVVVLGLGSILKTIPQAIRIIELLGASYLLFLAYHLLKTSYLDKDISLKKEIRNLIIYKKALYNADKANENEKIPSGQNLKEKKIIKNLIFQKASLLYKIGSLKS